MSDGPYRSLPMSPRWKLAAKCAYVGTFSTRDIADALNQAAERDCRAELSPSLIGKVRALIFGPNEPGLFGDLPISDLNAMHSECASPMEASFVRNAIDAVQDGYRGSEVLLHAAEGTVSDRLLAGYRQVEEHMYRKTTDQRARAVRSRLEGAHGEVDLSAVARRVLRAPGAPARMPSATYSGLDDGVSL
jgi:hypothetical protein